jgi:hypothetical protein
MSGPGIVALVGVWLCRRLLLSSGLPAGTDMLDVLARARQNASWQVLLSPWSPTGLGLPRQVSLDNLLGLLVLVMGEPVGVVKGMAVGLLMLSGFATYWVVFRWWKSRFAATAAGVLYMTSQASIGRLASGWLHYEVLIAATPLVLYLWVELLERVTVPRLIAFAVLLAGVAFARQDLVLWLVPALAVYVPIRLLADGRSLPTLRRLAIVGSVVPLLVLALSLYLVLPLAAGVHAPWLSTGEVFQQIRFNLLDRSLSAYQSLLGFGRDLGYLPFNGQEWWNGYPWLPLPLYYFVEGIVVFCAIAAMTVDRGRRALYLVAVAAMAAFLGKGIRSPLGEPYWWAVQHVPIFGSLRGPNRWMIPQAFAYSTLAALLLAGLRRGLLSRGWTPSRTYGVAGVAIGLLLIPVAPTLLSGFKVWRIPPTTVRLMDRIGSDRSQFIVASVPYDQSMTFVQQPGYKGWEHDIGVESPLYSDRSTLFTNSWGRRGSDFVDFTGSLLANRDPAFTGILGSIGVKYVLRLNYPAEADLVSAAAQGHRQQRDLTSLPGLTPVATSPTGVVYRLAAFAPRLSFRTNIALILGGRSGLSALARLPGVRLSDWAVYTADDLLSGSASGLHRLLAVMRTSDVILFAGASPNDIAVLASRPVAELAGITSDPGLDRTKGILLTDQSARSGSLADQAIAPPGIASSSSCTFIQRRAGPVELWSRVLASSEPARLTFNLDGRVVRSVVPVDPSAGGFRWVLVRRLNLGAGRHTLGVVASRSAYGDEFEIDETRLISPSVRAENLWLLRRQLHREASRVAYSLDASRGPFGNVQPLILSSRRRPFWRPQAAAGVRISYGRTPPTPVLRLDLVGRRRFFTIAQHAFRRPASWAGWSFAVLRYRGTGRGDVFNILVDFNSARTEFASFQLNDDTRGWHNFVFPLVPGHGDWRHVVSVRVSTPEKTGGGFIELGGVKLLFPRELDRRFELPTVPATAGSAARGAGIAFHIRRAERGSIVDVHVHGVRTTDGAAVLFRPAHALPHRSAVRVAITSEHPTRYGYSFEAARRGVLVLNQSYDPRWHISDRGGARALGPVTSLVDGFFMGPGRHVGEITFPGSSLMRAGVFASVALLSALLIVAAGTALLRRSRGGSTVSGQPAAARPPAGVAIRSLPLEVERSAVFAVAVFAFSGFSVASGLMALVCVSAPRRAGWIRPTVVAALLVLGSPLWIATGHDACADRAAVVATAAILVAVARASLELRRDAKAAS